MSIEMATVETNVKQVLTTYGYHIKYIGIHPYSKVKEILKRIFWYKPNPERNEAFLRLTLKNSDKQTEVDLREQEVIIGKFLLDMCEKMQIIEEKSEKDYNQLHARVWRNVDNNNDDNTELHRHKVLFIDIENCAIPKDMTVKNYFEHLIEIFSLQPRDEINIFYNGCGNFSFERVLSLQQKYPQVNLICCLPNPKYEQQSKEHKSDKTKDVADNKMIKSMDNYAKRFEKHTLWPIVLSGDSDFQESIQKLEEKDIATFLVFTNGSLNQLKSTATISMNYDLIFHSKALSSELTEANIDAKDHDLHRDLFLEVGKDISLLIENRELKLRIQEGETQESLLSQITYLLQETNDFNIKGIKITQRNGKCFEKFEEKKQYKISFHTQKVLLKMNLKDALRHQQKRKCNGKMKKPIMRITWDISTVSLPKKKNVRNIIKKIVEQHMNYSFLHTQFLVPQKIISKWKLDCSKRDLITEHIDFLLISNKDDAEEKIKHILQHPTPGVNHLFITNYTPLEKHSATIKNSTWLEEFVKNIADCPSMRQMKIETSARISIEMKSRIEAENGQVIRELQHKPRASLIVGFEGGQFDTMLQYFNRTFNGLEFKAREIKPALENVDEERRAERLSSYEDNPDKGEMQIKGYIDVKKDIRHDISENEGRIIQAHDSRIEAVFIAQFSRENLEHLAKIFNTSHNGICYKYLSNSKSTGQSNKKSKKRFHKNEKTIDLKKTAPENTNVLNHKSNDITPDFNENAHDDFIDLKDKTHKNTKDFHKTSHNRTKDVDERAQNTPELKETAHEKTIDLKQTAPENTIVLNHKSNDITPDFNENAHDDYIDLKDKTHKNTKDFHETSHYSTNDVDARAQNTPELKETAHEKTIDSKKTAPENTIVFNEISNYITPDFNENALDDYIDLKDKTHKNTLELNETAHENNNHANETALDYLNDF